MYDSLVEVMKHLLEVESYSYEKYSCMGAELMLFAELFACISVEHADVITQFDVELFGQSDTRSDS
jgi:hypothetical protein